MNLLDRTIVLVVALLAIFAIFGSKIAYEKAIECQKECICKEYKK